MKNKLIKIEPYQHNYSDEHKDNAEIIIPENSKKIYKALKKFGKWHPLKIKRFKQFDINRFLENFRKQSYLENKLENYSLGLHFGDKKFMVGNRIIYSDAPYNFVLIKEKNPIAFLGFEPHKELIFITQIQGIINMKKYLSSIKWPNALLNIATKWASELDIPEVFVLPSKRNQYPMVNENSYGAKMYYDVTAKREGFLYDSEQEVFRKRLR